MIKVPPCASISQYCTLDATANDVINGAVISKSFMAVVIKLLHGPSNAAPHRIVKLGRDRSRCATPALESACGEMVETGEGQRAEVEGSERESELRGRDSRRTLTISESLR